MAVDISGADQTDSLRVRLIQLLQQKRRVGEMNVQAAAESSWCTSLAPW
jgi:hypothetical protein